MSRSYTGADAVAALPGLVGRRVALRYRVTGTTLTDAVGELAPAGPDAVAVHTRGGLVTIGTVSVVAVREVPPARPKRPSWAAATRLEGICADAWPALVDRPLGQWRLRAAGGFTGRANGCLVIGDPGVPVPDALAVAREFAAAHGLPPRAQVVEGSPWHTAVAEQGWVPDDRHAAGWRVEVLVGDLAAGPPPDPPAPDVTPPDVVKITVEGRERWRVAAVEPGNGPFAEQFDAAQEYVLTAPSLPHVTFAVARRGAETIGSVRAVVLDEHLHVSRLSVADEHRRQGLGAALMAAAANWATERGARWCVLQVATDNAAALEFYRRLGYTPHHRYRYLRPPA